jgi:hypothetical protein
LKLAFLVALLLMPTAAFADPVSIAMLITTVAGTSTLIQAGILLATTLYTSASARKKQRKAAARARAEYNASLEDRSVSVLSALPAWQIPYGRTIVGGDIVAIFTSDKTGTRESGFSYTKPDALKHLVIEVAACEIEAIHDVLIDGVPVGALDGSGWATTGQFVTTTDDTRFATVPAGGFVDVPLAVTSILHAYYFDVNAQGNVDVTPTLSMGNTRITNPDPTNQITVDYKVSATRSHVRVGKHLGADDQAADAYLMSVAPAQWTSDHRLRGHAYVVLTLDLEFQQFQGGPPGVTFDVSGKKVLDTRTGLTAWTDNPALITRNWLTSPWGYGCAASDVDEAYCNAAANACDVLVSLDVGGVVTSGKRYTCNGVVSSAESREAVLADLEECMAGRVPYGAQWMICAGVWEPAVTLPDGTDTLTDDDLDGQIEIVQAGEGMDDIFNGLRGTYIPAGKATPTDFHPPYQNAAFVTADGQELWSDIALPFTDNPARCRNIARIKTEQARSGLVIRYPAKLKAWPLRVGDRTRVTSGELGYAAKYFRVTDWQFGLTSPVLLTLQEDDAEIWDLADAATADPTPNTNLPNPFVLSAITGLTAVSNSSTLQTEVDGTMTPRVLVSWNAVTDAYITDGTGRIELLWRVGTANWQKRILDGDDTSAYLAGMRAGDRAVIELRAVNGLGKVGPSVFTAVTVVGKTAAPANVAGFAATQIPTGVRLSWTAATFKDYADTEVHEEAVWSDATPPLRKATENSVELRWPSAGSHTYLAKHVDRSGNKSTTAASVTITVDADGLINSGQIKDGAATEIFQDIHDFAGAGFGSATPRSFSITPATNCKIEFTGKLTADNCLGDSGQFFVWDVSDGTTTTTLGGSETNNTLKTEFIGANTLTALAGVMLTFSIKTTVTGPSIHLFKSYMRVTTVKR